MIIVRIMGGLGNQLFQYAIGLALAHKKNTTLKLDLRTIERQPQRKFQLPFFNIPYERASLEEIAEVSASTPGSLMQRIFILAQGRLPYYMHRVITQKSRAFDPHIFQSPRNCYLDGYWQCEKYFIDERLTLLKQLTLKDPVGAKAEKICQKMVETNSVSLHIRRGDYVSNKLYSEVMGALSLEYYLKAVKKIEEKVADPNFFVFSDDLDWAKQNLKIPFPMTFVEHVTPLDNVEIMMMSVCKHHIIANSSFSWWGAWLGQFSQKVIIAPSLWFKGSQSDSRDICPVNWIRL